MRDLAARKSATFERRGIVEGFFGPLWSMAQRKRLFAFGAVRGMNTYLYAPKDDPYHRKRWRAPYPKELWREMLRLVDTAKKHQIDFVYGFHPGAALSFTEDEPVRILLRKARRFYDAGVRTFAVLFDDIPARLEHERDRREFANSLARAEATWLAKILAAQPASWRDAEWWICPSYYTPDPLLTRVFGPFEDDFLDKLAAHLPRDVACMWTGPAVVPEIITLAHVRSVRRRLQRRLIIWDNYPVNDLSMAHELHLAPLAGRDPRLPREVYGYLNNPLLQPALNLIPLASCFDYARDPQSYRPERSWSQNISELFGTQALPHWRTLRNLFDLSRAAKRRKQPLIVPARLKAQAIDSRTYLEDHRRERWAREIEPFWRLIKAAL
jgi:hyaluronoglucosaminidase